MLNFNPLQIMFGFQIEAMRFSPLRWLPALLLATWEITVTAASDASVKKVSFLITAFSACVFILLPPYLGFSFSLFSLSTPFSSARVVGILIWLITPERRPWTNVWDFSPPPQISHVCRNSQIRFQFASQFHRCCIFISTFRVRNGICFQLCK